MTTTERQQTGGGASGKTQEAVAQVQEKVQEKAQDLRSQASDRLRTQVDQRSNQAGEQVSSIVQALRKGAEHLDEQGNEAGAKTAHEAADQAQRLAKYLSGSSADKLLGDLEGFGRKRPWLAAGIGTAVGFIASRFLKASSERRYQASSQKAAPQASYPHRQPATRELPATAGDRG